VAKRISLTAATSFLAVQLHKTWRAPARLIVIPVNLLGPVKKKTRELFDELLFRLKEMYAGRWQTPRLSARECLDQALRCLQMNRPAEAWAYFSHRLHSTKDYVYLKTAAACLYTGLGRMREAIALQRRSDELRSAKAASLGLPHGKYFVLDYAWIAYIGHAAQIDYLVKLAIMDGRDRRDTIVYFPPEYDVGNRFVVEQWAPHLRLVTSAHELPFAKEALEHLALNFIVPAVPGHARQFLWELAAQTHRRWHAQGRKPVLELSKDVYLRGREALVSVGVPGDAWFVCLHVREPHYTTRHSALHHVLNADIVDYLPAMNEVTRRGGWVIRMGDPAMTPLAPMPNVLDYCHSGIRSDWMDVFLAATCRFFVGTASGPCYVPQNYGVPCVLTNWWPPAQRPWQPGDIFIPKLLRRSATGQVLSLEQSLEEPFGYCNSIEYLGEAHGVVIQDNDPEDIRSAVVEMLDRVAARASYDESDIALRERAERIYAAVAMRLYNSSGAFGSASLARDFLRRHPELLAT
jgi:putative glycosyltransferase (TIGR04372 family)